MKRREFITLLSRAAAWPLAARAQQLAMPAIGFLSSALLGGLAQSLPAFRQGIHEAEFVDGRSRSARACYCCASGAWYNSARSTMTAIKKHRNAIFSTVCPPRTTRLEREGVQNQSAGNDRTQDQSE